ncbi:MAG: tRNA 2-thiouridine(34) synthase MnmA [Phycisphaerales bacterium]|nr:tRNA 2-thiouridine(34) synthase MnmA [Phycisphaerales bacterium]MCI0629465.1 tRNA 2-thiouridine(34) synthase MnmA [Phycisphaerales bacterium]MCI0676930.1 tRNA 2-thiouridine(34) synthase MnmA [Phycisphaerales bacterium]
MSGGVDSSVAAALLLREGYDVVGCFMRLGSPGESFDELIEDAASDEPSHWCRGTGGASSEEDGGSRKSRSSKRLRIGHQGCCSINDAADARMVASKLGIPFYVCNFKKDFGRIIDYFVGEYNAGRTPNPCVRCNDWLKFGKLHDYAQQIDAQFVASGHYARIEPAEATERRSDEATKETRNSQLGTRNYPRLLRGVDHTKDQSYVLFGAPRERLAEMLLPIGGYRKPYVRELAREFDLPVFDKPDSQEICFVPDNDYTGLVARRTPEALRPGKVLASDGTVIGEHAGHQHFTIGQRKGVGVALGHPVYVVSKDASANTVTVGEREELLAERCVANEANWLSDESHEWLPCAAKIRYNAQPVPARVRRVGSLDRAIEVEFQEPQAAVAPGQAVVCYDHDAVICGGWISAAE